MYCVTEHGIDGPLPGLFISVTQQHEDGPRPSHSSLAFPRVDALYCRFKDLVAPKCTTWLLVPHPRARGGALPHTHLQQRNAAQMAQSRPCATACHMPQPVRLTLLQSDPRAGQALPEDHECQEGRAPAQRLGCVAVSWGKAQKTLCSVRR